MTMKYAEVSMRVCSWIISSTNSEGIGELPTACKNKGCSGFFAQNFVPLCESFVEPRRPELRARIFASIGRK